MSVIDATQHLRVCYSSPGEFPWLFWSRVYVRRLLLFSDQGLSLQLGEQGASLEVKGELKPLQQASANRHGSWWVDVLALLPASVGWL